MYKRSKKENLSQQNFITLKRILNNDEYFYSIQFTKDVLKEAKEEIALRQIPIQLYSHIDDFTDIKRIVYSPFFAENVNSFCKLNGFGELISELEEEKDRNIHQLIEYYFINVFRIAFRCMWTRWLLSKSMDRFKL